MLDRRLIVSWILNTCLGWLLGVPIIIALALVGEGGEDIPVRKRYA